MKKLNLINIRVGQTIYFVNDNLFETVPWGKDNPVKVWVEQLRVTNDPIPPLGTQLINDGKVSAKALREAAEFYSFNRPPHIKATRKQAERYAEQERRKLNPKPVVKKEKIKPEEGGKCPLGCEGSKLEYQAPGNCTCHNSAPCFRCESAVLECNQCGNEFEG